MIERSTMSLSTWRQFQLFESIPIKDPFIESENALYSDHTLTAIASLNETYIAIAVQSSLIKIVDLHDMRVQFEFEAYTSEYQLTYLERVSDSFVLSVGECIGKPLVIKLWNLEKMPTDERKYHAMTEVRNGSNSYPVSSISCSLHNSCIAVGFTDGHIILVRGDLLRDRGSKYRIIYEDPNKEPITAVSLNNDARTLFATTTSKIMLFNTSGRNNGKPDMILNDTEGVDLKCGVMNKSTDEFICAMKNRLDIFMSSGGKRSLIVDITHAKQIFPISEDSLLILMSNEPKSTLHLGNTSSETTRALILDTKNKIVSLTLLVTSSVIDIFNDRASINLLTSDGFIYKLKEKKLEDQIKTICQKEIYPVALKIAEQHSLPIVRIQEIRKLYADYLFKKGSKREAIEQYMESLDVCDPTEIISKFGVEQKTNSDDSINLRDFLWTLVREGKAKVDHVTLLLTLMIKLHDLKGLEFFISNYRRDGTFANEPETFGKWSMTDDSYFYSDKKLFDLDTVVRLLLESDLLELAHKFVLKFSKDPVNVINIVLLQKKDALESLNYIKSLPVDDALRVLIKFSKKLLDMIPNETNLLLIDLFTGKYQPSDYDAGKTNLKYKEGTAKEKNESEDSTPLVFYNYHSFFEYMLPSSASGASNSDQVSIHEPTYHPPKPNLIFSSFVQKPFEFVVFLEACLETYKRFQGYDQDRQEILTTLYDIYLSLSEDDIDERKPEWKSKAEAVLKESENRNLKPISGKDTDKSLMLLISHMHDMNPFTLSSVKDEEVPNSLISHVSLSDVFRSMCLTSHPKECLTFLEQYGSKDHELYKVAMSHFISRKQIYDDIGGDDTFKEEVLNKVLEFDLMSPLDIIQTLSSTNVVKYGVIKEFLVNYLKTENAEIKKNEMLVESYQKELEQKKSKLKELIASESPLQVKVKKRLCDGCTFLIDFPMVYFKCGHLYHQRCLNEESDSDLLYRCPQCVLETESGKKIMESYKTSTQNPNLLRAALSDLEPKDDRFGIVTDFIGKGGLDDPNYFVLQS